jgi:uncharacterized protein
MSDQIIRDIPLIARYSRHNEDADWRFRSYMKGYLNLSDEKLDAIVREETDRVWAQIDCTTCANCCKTMQVVVDDKDIKRLADRLGMTTRAFSKKHVKIEDVPFRSKVISTQPCPFLGEDNRCTVYEDRPQACRDFPFLHKDRFRSRSITMVSNLEVCPIVFNVWQALKTRLWRRRR